MKAIMERNDENISKDLSLADLYERKEMILAGEDIPAAEKPLEKRKSLTQKTSEVLQGLIGGCGCLVLVLGFGGPAPLIPFFFPAWFTSSGEHRSSETSGSRFTTEKGTNFSYHEMFMHQMCEFDISEADFLDMREDAIPVETLPNLPLVDGNKYPRINYQREVPITIPRYNYAKPEHKDCSPFGPPENCKFDPGGKMGEACSHAVSKGYYRERRSANGGGICVLYDKENGRCYIHSNHH